MKEMLITLLIFVATLATTLSVVGQCSCSYVTPDSRSVEIAFVGRVLSIVKEEGRSKYQVEISEIFKGLEEQREIVVFDSFYNCSERPPMNKEHLFMARKDEATGEINIIGCSYSYRNKHQQKQMIEIFRWKKRAQNRTSLVVGKVVDSVNEAGISRKPKGVDKVFAENENGDRFESNIEGDGFYKFENLKNGQYKLFLRLPAMLTTYGDRHDFDNEKSLRLLDISDGSGVIADFSISVNGIIGGKVVSSNGTPVGSIKVNLLRLEGGDLEEEDSIETDPSGAFKFTGLPKGRFLIRVGAEDWYIEPNSLEALYPTTFYPSANSQKKAVVIRLNDAQILNDRNITLLPILAKRTVTGIVLMPDGRPAQYADVAVQIRRRDPNVLLRSGWHIMTSTDRNGNFELDVYEETDYLVQVDIDKPTGPVTVEVLFSSKCFALPKNGPQSPIKIQLEKGDTECKKESFGF